MMHSLLHIMLLVAATLVIWLVRSRVLVAVVCFLILPLPAALFYLYAAPNPTLKMVEPVESSADDCTQQPPLPSGSSSESKQDEASTTPAEAHGKADCPPSRNASSKQIQFAVIAVNYLTVLIGLIAGLFAHKPVPRERRGHDDRGT